MILLLVGSAEAAEDWIVLSQHRASDNLLWWRAETPPVSEADCWQHLKAVTGRPVVGATKWYDVTPEQLAQHFGTVATPTRGSWVACWSANVWRHGGVIWAEPDK